MRLLSYNVLADSYVRREWFPETAESLLAPGARTLGVAKRIAGFNADLICLQEVELRVFEALSERLTGWHGEWLQKGNGKPDGCATFSRQKIDSVARHRYSDGSGHVALVVVVEAEGRRLAVANTHLRWSPPDTSPANHLGFCQLGALLRSGPELASSVDGWIVCGDLNVEPESDAIALLIDAGFVDCFGSQPFNTCNSNGKPKRIDYVFVSAGIESSVIPSSTTDRLVLPSVSEPSDHLPIGVDFQFTSPWTS